MPIKPPATQHDVARALGIGQKTVSRAFTDPEAVSADLRDRIHAAARRMGYRAHASARAMRTGRFDHILVVQSRKPSVSSLPEAMLGGLVEALAAAGLGVGIERFDDDQLASEGFLPRTLAQRAADGVILNYDTNVPVELEAHVRRHRLPCVWLNRERDSDCARPDDFGAGRMVGEHLTKLGHRRVLYADAHLAWTGVRHYSRDHRLAGARAALAEVGGELNTWLPTASITGVTMADELAATLMRERPTAVIAYSAIETSAVVYAAARSGIRLPEDLSLATFGEQPEFIGLPIATALIDGAGVGLAAGDMLMARIADPRRAAAPVLVPFSFTPGATLAPAR